MVAFNPSVSPTSDPNYLGYAKPVSQPQGDQSAKYKYGTIANLLGGLVTGADTMLKQNIQETVYNEVDPVRNELTRTLQDVKGVLSGSPDDIKGDLKTLHARAAELKGAYNSGTISLTKYKGKITEIAKDMRSHYPPAYRPFIDATVSRASGIPVANALISSLTADINSALGSQKAEQNKVITLIARHLGEEDSKGVAASAMINAVQRDPNLVPAAYDWLQRVSASTVEMEKERRNLELDKLRTEANYRKTSKFGTDLVSLTVANSMDTTLTSSGITPQKLIDYYHDVQFGRVAAPTPAEQAQAAQVMQGFRSSLKTALEHEFDRMVTDKDGNPYTLTSRLRNKAEDRKKMIDEGMSAVDQFIKDLTGKPTPIAAMDASIAKGMQDRVLRNLYGSSFGNTLLKINGLRQAGGNDWIAQLAVRGNLTSVTAEVAALVADKKMNLIDLPNPGSAPVFKNTLNELHNSPISSPSVIKDWLSAPKEILSPWMPDHMKIPYIKSIYHPEGNDVATQFAGDQPWTVYRTLSTNAITDEIYRLNKQDHTVGDAYRGWNEREFVKLFTDKILDINKYVNDPNIGIAWDPENHMFRAFLREPAMRKENVPGRLITPPASLDAARATVLTRANQDLNLINGGLQNLAYIYKTAGDDVNLFLLNTLSRKAGLDITAQGNPLGIEPKMIKAISGMTSYIDTGQTRSVFDKSQERPEFNTLGVPGYPEPATAPIRPGQPIEGTSTGGALPQRQNLKYDRKSENVAPNQYASLDQSSAGPSTITFEEQNAASDFAFTHNLPDGEIFELNGQAWMVNYSYQTGVQPVFLNSPSRPTEHIRMPTRFQEFIPVSPGPTIDELKK